ncbi:neural cell adhesion molecule 2-like isoform X2 [Oculina patagonica]
MGGSQVGSVLRALFALGILSVHQLSVTDAEIEMLRNGITTRGKTFRVVCTVKNERFVGWYDLTGERVTSFLDEDELPEDKYYVEETGNSYTLVIQEVVVADGGNYTCRGDKTTKVFTLYVEFFVTQFPSDQDLFVGKSQVIKCSAEGYPKPTFKWYKKRRLVKFSDPRFTLLSNGSLLINPVHELDMAEYICRITQLGEGEEGTNLREEKKVIKVTVYGPPRINLERSSSSKLYSYIGNPSPVTITCVWWGYPIPALSIKKNNKALPSEDVRIDGPRLEATVTIDSEDDFADYTCHATNTYGEATYAFSVMKAGKPTPPTNITFATTCDHLTVAWNQPESDGGLPLTHYTIELKDDANLLDEVFVGVQTNRFTFTSREGVEPRTLYTVSVQAFNKLNDGTKGEDVVMSAYCPPSGPFNITNTVTWLNTTSFMLRWTRPPQDGGDPDLKYDIEYSKANSEGKFVHWNSRKGIEGQEYNVTGLARGSRYEFRVFVSNIAGRKREPASKEFNVYSGDDEGPGPDPGGITQPVLVYDISINCTSHYMQVDFTLKSSYLDVESFHFDNASCGSRAANSTHVSLRTLLDACGTTSRQSEDSVTYFNKVVAETKDQKTVYVVEFPFSCAYNRRETIGTPSFQPRKKITFFEEGYGNFSFEMGLYRSSEYASPYEVSEYPVTINPFGQLYCQAKLESSDPDLVLRADACVATPSMDPSHSVQYKFIEDG